MILSTSHNFIFVHVPKTAGTAMTAALEPFGITGTRTMFRRMIRRLPVHEAPDRAYFRKHETATDIRRKLTPAVYDRFFRFAVVRNPFDHAVSHYEYLKEFRNAKMAEAFSRMSFRDYLKMRSDKAGWNDRFFVMLPDQAHFLVDGQGGLLVNRLLRFESLTQDFGTLAHDLGLGQISLARINPTKAKAGHRPYHDYYDGETETMVRGLYERDFDLLGYDIRL